MLNLTIRMVLIALHVDDFQPTYINACSWLYAFYIKNKGYSSVIIAPEGSSGSLEGYFRKIPTLMYKQGLQIDEFCFAHGITIFYKLLPTSATEVNIPVSIPSCIHYLKDDSISSQNAAGDIRVLASEDNIFPSTLVPGTPRWQTFLDTANAVSHGSVLLNTGFDKYIDTFARLFAEPASKMSNTFGVSYGGEMNVIFYGTKTTERVILFNVAKLPPPLPSPQVTPLVHKETSSPLQALKDVLKSATFVTPPEKRRYRIKLLCNWTSSLHLDWKYMEPESTRLEINTSADESQTDFYVIINRPPLDAYFDPKRTLVFRMEPYIENNSFYNDWLKDIPKEKFLYFFEHEHFRNNTEWWLNKTVKELASVEITKTGLISAILSSQYVMEGHRLRVDFVKYFQQHSKVSMDIYGYDNTHGFSNHKGSLPDKQKDAGIIPYKYTFAAENSNIPNYFTEKIIDAILAESLCFYWGCSNLEEFIDPGAFIRLDLNNPIASLKTIEDAIANNEWEKRLSIIKNEKKKIYIHFNFYSRVQILLDIHSNVKFHHMRVSEDSNQTVVIPGITLIDVPYSLQVDGNIMITQLRNYALPVTFLPQITRLSDHHRLWQQCERENKIHCNFEGISRENFLDHISTLLSAAEGCEWDMIFLYWKNPKEEPNARLAGGLQFVPLWNYIAKYSEKTMNNGQEVNAIIHGNLSCGYLIHPRGAAKLNSLINAHGFMFPLDELMLAINNFIPNFKSFLSWKNLVSDAYIIPATEPYYIFRKLSDGQYSNAPIQFEFPPRVGGEVLLISDSQLKQQIASNIR